MTLQQIKWLVDLCAANKGAKVNHINIILPMLVRFQEYAEKRSHYLVPIGLEGIYTIGGGRNKNIPYTILTQFIRENCSVKKNINVKRKKIKKCFFENKKCFDC